MASLNTGKIAEVMFNSFLDTHEEQTQILGLVDTFTAAPGGLQNSNNIVWRPWQQHRPVLSGWDLTGQAQGIIEETYPAVLGTPTNDFTTLRADDLRDTTFWERAGREAGLKQASTLNKSVAQAVAQQGSLAYRTNVTSGFDYIANAQAIMDERQVSTDGRNFILSTRDNYKFAKDLAGRQTLQGRPASVWESGQIGQNVASFDVYTGSYLQNQVGGADPATTVTANQSFKPEGGSVSATGVVTNVDCRTATIPVTASASYNIGDKVVFKNGGVSIKALGLMDKTNTAQDMTFTIVAKPSGTSITVYPKPIAADDPALSTLEKAYANVDTRILNTATVNRINLDALATPSVFFSRDAVEVFHGEIDARLFSEFGGKKVISSKMKSGQTAYMIYDSNPTTMELSYRMFVWYGVTVKNPMACGVAISY
jgi:hypothetical protein